MPPTLQWATANPHFCQRLLDTDGQVWFSLLWSHCSFLLHPGVPGFCLCPPRVCFPSPVYILVALWQINRYLLQEGLCHMQVYCTQSPCACSSPLLTCTSAGDTQTQFCLSIAIEFETRKCGVSSFVFFLKSALAILGLLWFHTNFSIIWSISVKNAFEILMEIMQNL